MYLILWLPAFDSGKFMSELSCFWFCWNIIHSFIPLACAECDDSLPFSGASSIPLCYIPFPSTLFHQLVFHSPSLHLVISFLIYLSTLLFLNPYTIFLGDSISFHSLYMPKPTLIYLTLPSLLYWVL
jgi:hypothetical protein